MQRTLLGLIAATALTAAIPAVANAQTINERQQSLFSRIDAGIRAGQLTRPEGDRLRSDFYALERLEGDYRRSRPGLTNAERADLNRRFDALSNRIRIDRNNGENYVDWQPIAQRQDRLYSQIEAGVRGGGLTRREADRLRSEFNGIVRLESDYRRSGGGLTRVERQDLDQRLTALSQRINAERRDGQQRDRRG